MSPKISNANVQRSPEKSTTALASSFRANQMTADTSNRGALILLFTVQKNDAQNSMWNDGLIESTPMHNHLVTKRMGR